MSILKENDPWTWGGGWAQGLGQDVQGRSSPRGGAPSPLSPPSLCTTLLASCGFLGDPEQVGTQAGPEGGRQGAQPCSNCWVSMLLPTETTACK